jgi:hypothetical protein
MGLLVVLWLTSRYQIWSGVLVNPLPSRPKIERTLQAGFIRYNCSTQAATMAIKGLGGSIIGKNFQVLCDDTIMDVLVEKVRGTLVNWAACCELENKQNLVMPMAYVQLLTRLPMLALCLVCHTKFHSIRELCVNRAEQNYFLAAPGMFLSQSA